MIAAMAQTLPRNADVAEQLELLSDILELEGEAAYRLLAYRRAAALVREQSGLVAELALEGKAKELPGIGKTIEGKIVEIVNEGEIRALTKHKALVPPDVIQFTRRPGLVPKTSRKIWQELGVTTLADMKAAAKAERLRLLPGIGAKLEERIVKELSGKRKAPEEVRPLLGAGLPAVQAVVAVLREHPAALQVSEAGSARRRKETFRDLDVIATATEPAELTDYFTKLRWVEKVAARGQSKATVVSNDGLRFDLRVVRRQDLDRGDGRRSQEPRLLLPSDYRPLALPAGRPARGSGSRDRRAAGAARALPAAEGDRGEHPRRRDAGRRRRDARGPRLGRRLAAHCLRQEPDRASAGRDGEPERGLHRASDGAKDQPPRAGRHRPRSRVRDRACDQDVPRDQLPAGPARPSRRPCAGSRGGGPAAFQSERRALHAGARVSGDWPRP